MFTKKDIHKPSLPAARTLIPASLLLILFLLPLSALALEPNQILIIANSEIPDSVALARYYCQQRKVSPHNIVLLPLGQSLADNITRDYYNKLLATPLLAKLAEPRFAGKIKCLLTTWGVPFRVSGRGPLMDEAENLTEVKRLIEQQKLLVNSIDANISADQRKENNLVLLRLQAQADYILGKETDAAVDSELSCLPLGDYELFRWQPNKLKRSGLFFSFGTLMVCRLDAPHFSIARNLVDKALIAESRGLHGFAYVDSGYKMAKNKTLLYYDYDQSLRYLADILRRDTNMRVELEETENLFAPGQCPQTAIYCGWYSLAKYVDAFDFVDGAIGYHIASYEAVKLRDPNSSQWCPAMLKDGVTACIGPVAEPYLTAFPKPDEFFSELLNGSCLVEAYYRTLPFVSWQMVLIGDPLYTPFKKR